MHRYILALSAAMLFALSACGGGGGGGGTMGGGGGGNPPPTTPPQPANTVGFALPTGLIGVENDPTWGIVGGYTQAAYSQVLAFPVGATITLKNISASTAHTFNVIGMTNGPPVSWPNATLSTSASGGTSLGAGYASGTLNAGQSVTVTLSTPGTFMIGCAYHYASNQMRDIIMVSNSAVPGPQATPPPSGGGGGCGGPYC